MKATEDAISNPATTKLTRISLKSLTFFDTDKPGTTGTVEVGIELLRRLLQFEEEFEFELESESLFESFDMMLSHSFVKFVRKGNTGAVGSSIILFSVIIKAWTKVFTYLIGMKQNF